jgi:hypothetical protein
MKTLLCATAFLALTAAAGSPAWAEKAACTATIETGKKYHWVTFQNGAPYKSGYVLFTDTKSGDWTKVVHFTDDSKAKLTFWGTYDSTRVRFKNTTLGEYWTAWMKYCEGPKLQGNITKDDKIIHAFHIDTSRVRD